MRLSIVILVVFDILYFLLPWKHCHLCGWQLKQISLFFVEKQMNRLRNIHNWKFLLHSSISVLIRELFYLRISGTSLMGYTCAKERSDILLLSTGNRLVTRFINCLVNSPLALMNVCKVDKCRRNDSPCHLLSIMKWRYFFITYSSH